MKYEKLCTMESCIGVNNKLKIYSKQPIKLPPATAEYYELDAKGRKITTRSQEVEINIKSPEKIST